VIGGAGGSRLRDSLHNAGAVGLSAAENDVVAGASRALGEGAPDDAGAEHGDGQG
jgi:hypothetical protein